MNESLNFINLFIDKRREIFYFKSNMSFLLNKTVRNKNRQARQKKTQTEKNKAK